MSLFTSPRVVGTVAACLAFDASACTQNPSPTAASTTTTVAAPTTTEEFTGTVGVGGSTFYSFTIEQNGTVNVTLVAVQGAFVPPTVTLGLGIGTPSGTDCSTTSTQNAVAGSTAQLTGTYGPGVFCAKVSDVGNLFAPASFTATIAHP
jgi:hypothetical protein